MFYTKTILNSNEVLGKVNIKKGVKDSLDYILKVPVKVVLGKHDDKLSYSLNTRTSFDRCKIQGIIHKKKPQRRGY